MEQKSLSVFDYSGKKVCDLYDSTVQTPGQAFDISVTTEITGVGNTSKQNIRCG